LLGGKARPVKKEQEDEYMSERTNIYIEISDQSLKEKTYQRLSEDWTINWTFVSREKNKAEPEDIHIAIIDNPKWLSTISDKAVLVFLGKPDNDAPYFSILEEVNPDSLFTVIKRAYSYREITNQNAESLYTPKDKDSLESIAQSLSVRVHQLMKQSEMRIALVDQMPVGILGIDDESSVVLANPKAIEALGMEDLPIWGLKATTLLTDNIDKFLKDEDAEETEIVQNGARIAVRKSNFYLEENYAGIILALWELDDEKK
jgi:PAS domain-containing protein